MTRRLRFLLALLCGLSAGLVSHCRATTEPTQRDVGQVWYAARVVREGRDPYQAIGPGREYNWACPLFYPMPAVLAAVPLSFLSATAASGIFMVLAATAFAWALLATGYAPLLGFFSAAMYFAVEVVQWSPLLAAGLVAAPLSALWIVKPTIGAALLVTRPTRWAFIGGAGLLALSFAVQPGWLPQWLGVIGQRCIPHTPYRAPIVVPGGFLALLSLLRWRRPEARLIAALACVPQTLLPYEVVPLFLVPRTIREVGLLTGLSWLGIVWLVKQPIETAEYRLVLSGQMMVLCYYLPCTLMVLRRPNEGTENVANALRWWRRTPADRRDSVVSGA